MEAYTPSEEREHKINDKMLQNSAGWRATLLHNDASVNIARRPAGFNCTSGVRGACGTLS